MERRKNRIHRGIYPLVILNRHQLLNCREPPVVVASEPLCVHTRDPLNGLKPRTRAINGVDSLQARVLDCGTKHVRSQVQSGRAVPGITQAVAQLGVDLVAMGTRGRSDLPYTLLGSVAQQMLREMPCDVLLARPTNFHFELP
jgi:nucleotide-binding universal stress UspA family protein